MNADLSQQPELVNSDPYGGAWMVKMKPANASELSSLLSPGDYAKLL